MCDDCFNEEYIKFNSDKEYNLFLKKLDTKIAKTVLYVKSEKYRNDFHTIYKCIKCNEVWLLSDPDNQRRGYFLKETTAKNSGYGGIYKSTSFNLVYLFLLFIVILILITLLI